MDSIDEAEERFNARLVNFAKEWVSSVPKVVCPTLGWTLATKLCFYLFSKLTAKIQL